MRRRPIRISLIPAQSIRDDPRLGTGPSCRSLPRHSVGRGGGGGNETRPPKITGLWSKVPYSWHVGKDRSINC